MTAAEFCSVLQNICHDGKAQEEMADIFGNKIIGAHYADGRIYIDFLQQEPDEDFLNDPPGCWQN